MMSITALLEGYNEAEYDGEIRLSPCAYLHNYPDHDGAITDPIYADHIRRAPMFLKGDVERRRLQDFIKTHVRWGDRGQTLYAIELGRIRPSKSLADALAGLMKGKSEFVLITQARKVSENGKHVLIVEGGPGTPSALL